MDKPRIKSSEMIIMAMGAIWLILGMSCEKTELTHSMEENEYTVKICDSVKIEDSFNIEDKSGISFEMGNDSLEEDIENVYFHTKEWEEEIMDTNI